VKKNIVFLEPIFSRFLLVLILKKHLEQEIYIQNHILQGFTGILLDKIGIEKKRQL
jgi:hypothetical protein